MLRIAICFLCMLVFSSAFGTAVRDQFIYICAKTDNDLYQLLKQEGYRVKRYQSAKAAIEAAPAGTVVLVTALLYPDKRTPVEPALYDLARQKVLRLYVEFPDVVPGVGLDNRNYSGKLERAVITFPGFFKGAFEDGAILGLSSAEVIPVRQDVHPVISFAKVAGYKKAAYGLSHTTVYPLLFIRDGILIATTCLSNFKTASFRPVESWKKVWCGILRHLTGVSVTLNSWAADPEPTYTEKEMLPPMARLEAIKRGSEWFYNAKFIIHPSWYPRLMKIAGDGSHPVGSSIQKDWPVGDGSFGVLEGHVSNVHPNGSQDIRYMIRNDVQGEVAFALAAAAEKAGNRTYSATSRNMLDFLFYTSNARKGLRNEKSSPVYGMLGWADAVPYLFYNDDHARAVLGSIGASAYLKDTSWNEKIVETILANFRLSSREGFIGNRLSESEILTNGWAYYNKRTFISPHPHFESWTWACYLWLYDKTHYKPLLEKAKSAIRITMDAYPRLWKWTNGIQQERARMILPLAWLVRVEDTPRHRDWLNFMVKELLRFQQENGAIQEQVGDNGMGQAGLVMSNEDYGKYEAALIALNGDPASDMLYTSNFAFFALNEAASVSGNPEYIAAVNKLSDFLVRIQVKSRSHPDLNGAWFRGFDYEQWDYWGSNADEEWGVWCTLTGWIQSWIVGTMALVDNHKSYWELTREAPMQSAFNKAKWMLKDLKQ